MSEAQTVENTPDSILIPRGAEPVAYKKGGDRLSQIAAKHLSSLKAAEPIKETGNGEDKTAEIPPTVPVEEPANTEEKPAEETPKEEPKIETKPDSSDSLDKKRSIIRRENQLRKKYAAIKEYEAQKEAFEEYKRNSPLVKEYLELKELAKSNPTLANEKLGLSYDKWTQHLLSQSSQPKTPEQLEIERIKVEQDKIKKDLEAKENNIKKAQEQAAIAAFVNETESAIKKDVDKYELILLNNQIGQVTNLRAQEAFKNKDMPSAERAAEHIEKQFENHWLDPFIEKSKKLRARLISKGWQPPKTAEDIKKPVGGTKQVETKTLSTELTTGSAPSPSKKTKDRDQRLAELIREHRL